MLEIVDWGPILRENPFRGVRLYFTNAIVGGESIEPEIWWRLKSFVERGAGEFLDPHVAARNKEERDKLFAETAALLIAELGLENEDPAVWHTEFDLTKVEIATHLIGCIDNHTTGGGIEIGIAQVKHRMGLNLTPILLLAKNEKVSSRSSLTRGVRKQRHPEFYLRGYETLQDVQRITFAFLTGERSF